MAYTINLSDGTVLATVPDNSINDTAADIILIGRNYAEYGEIINENYVHLLDNFANNTEPASPHKGQLWWDTANNVLKVWKQQDPDPGYFVPVSGTTSAGSSPANPVEGDFWWNSDTSQLYVWNEGSSSWVLVGPTYSSGQGESGSVASVLTDTGGIDHVVVFNYVDGVVISVESRSPTFEAVNQPPNIASTIYPGLNMSTNRYYHGGIYLLRDMNVGTRYIVSPDNEHVRIQPGVDGKFIVKETQTVLFGRGGQTGFVGGNSTDVLRVENNESSANIHIISADDSIQEIKFSADSDPYRTGVISYNHATNNMTLGVNGAVSTDNSLVVHSDGRIVAGKPNYETIVNTNNTLTNKKYVDDAIATSDGTTGNFTVTDGNITINSTQPAIIFNETDQTNPDDARILVTNDNLVIQSPGGGEMIFTGRDNTNIPEDGFLVKQQGNYHKIWSDHHNIVWNIRIATFSASAGDFYHCRMGSAFSMVLPPTPVIGQWVTLRVNGQAETNNLTINRNGQRINGLEENLIIDMNYLQLTLVYVDSTTGWEF